MSNINKAAVLNPFTDLTANILDYVPRATTSEFGIVAIGSGINVDALGRIYLDTQEYSDRLTTIDAHVASTLATQKSEVAAAIAQVNLTQSQAITALTLEVSNLKTDLTNSITATQTDLINRADQLAQDVTDITQQLIQDKATFTQEIQDALDYLQDDASVASALRTPRKIQGVDFDGTQDISLPTFTAETDGLVPKRVGTTADSYLREDGTWQVPTNTEYPTITSAEVYTGTDTTGKLVTAALLKQAVTAHTPTVTNIAGNAGTATRLQAVRTINGTAFSGAVNITTNVWGSTRTLTIGSTAKPVNGTIDVSWSLAEIGAAAMNHNHAYLSTSGGTLSGNLSVTGEITAASITSSGNITAFSDARLKDNIITIDDALNKVSKLKGVTYNRIDMDDKDKRYLGLIAQDVQSVIPEAVNINNDEISTLSVDYQGLIGLLVESIKELKLEIDELKEKVK